MLANLPLWMSREEVFDIDSPRTRSAGRRSTDIQNGKYAALRSVPQPRLNGRCPFSHPTSAGAGGTTDLVISLPPPLRRVGHVNMFAAAALIQAAAFDHVATGTIRRLATWRENSCPRS